MASHPDRWDEKYAPQGDIHFNRTDLNFDSGQNQYMGSNSTNPDHFYAHVTDQKPNPAGPVLAQRRSTMTLNENSSDSLFGLVTPPPVIQIQRGQANGKNISGGGRRATTTTSSRQLSASVSSTTTDQSSLLSKTSAPSKKIKKFRTREDEADYWKRREANNIAAQKSRACKTKRLSEAEIKIKDLESQLRRSQNELLTQAQTIDTLTKNNETLVTSNHTLTQLLKNNSKLEERLNTAKKIVDQNRYQLAIARKTCEEKQYIINDLNSKIAQLEIEKSANQSLATQNQEFQNLTTWDSGNQWPEFSDSMVIDSGFVPADQNSQFTKVADAKGQLDALLDEDIGFSEEEMDKLIKEFFQSTTSNGVSQGNGGKIGRNIDMEISNTMQPGGYLNGQ